MAVAYVGVTSGNSGSATSTSFATSLPAGWAAGDVAVLVGHVSGVALTMGTPAGWTLLSGVTWPVAEDAASRLYAWSRVLQAGDVAPTITNSGSVTGGWECTAWRGATGVAQVAAATSSATSVTLPTLTGVGAGSALLVGAHCRVPSGTIPTDLTPDPVYAEAVDHATSRVTSAANVRMAAAYRTTSTAGSYGGETVTSTTSGSMIGLLIEVTPATTQVSQTVSTGWAVAAEVFATRATAWSTLTQVAASVSSAWSVAAQALTSTATTWSVAATASAGRSTAWSIAASTSTTTATRWDTAAEATTSPATRWDTLGQVAAATGTGWATAGQTTASTSTSWSTLGRADAQTATGWSVASTVPASTTTGWSTAAEVATPTGTAWSTAMLVDTGVTTLWAVGATQLPPPARGAIRVPAGSTVRAPAGSTVRTPPRSEVTLR